MITLQQTPELLEVARRVVWFKDPEETLRDATHFLAYVMRYGDDEDISAILRAGIDLKQLSEALDNAPAGVFDARSWNFWNLKCGRETIPPLPTRKLSLG
jgi:hypothetical protein